MTNLSTRRQFLRRALVGGVGLSGLFLAACGGESSATTVSSNSDTTKPPATAPSASATGSHTNMPGMNMAGTPTPLASSAAQATPAAPTSGSGTPGASPVAKTGTATTAPVEIKIVEPGIDYQTWTYQPNTVSVPVGTTVTWTNTGGAAHTVTADDGTSFDSGSVAPDKQFTLTMHTAGTFPYHCTFHPFMKSTITVTP
jgi:plastocyanin